MPITVFIADDHAMMREGLRLIIEAESDISVIGEAADGRQAVRLVQRLAPDVVIMDIAMPDINGIEVTRQLKSELTDIKIIALSMHSDRRFVSEILKAGASAYVLKHAAFEDLEKASGIHLTVWNYQAVKPV